MGLDFVNRHVAKIMLAVEDGDSINRLSEKIDSSYSYTYDWINRLEEIGVLKRENGIKIEDSDFLESFRNIAVTVLKKDLKLEEAYLLPNFSGMDYRYSKTDAVYVWTKGGYQIARNRSSYPIFIDVHRDDLEDWKSFLEQFGLEVTVEETGEKDGIYFVLYPRKEMEIERVESASVMPLEETVEWAENYMANFEPALEMLEGMYDLNIDAEYSERKVMTD